MGCISSTMQDTANVNIDKKPAKKYKPVHVEQIRYKLLILGAGQSGKSTLLKQFRMLYEQKHLKCYDKSELLRVRHYYITHWIIENKWILSQITKDNIYWLNYIYLMSGYIRKQCHDLYIPQCIQQLFGLFIGYNNINSIYMYQPFNESELRATKPYIIENLIETMRTLAIFSDILSDKGKDTKVMDENKEIRDRVARMNGRQKFTKDIYEDFAKLWADPHIHKTLEYRNQYDLIDTAEYLFSNMNDYWRDDYIPTFKDSIHHYQRTVGVNKIRFVIPDKYGEYEEIYEIYDVGGARNERRKWIHFLDDTAAIIFVAALSGYNEVLWEDYRSNRMREAINLFRGIVNLDVFKDSHVILLLNKCDLFERKVGKYPVKEHFKDFKGKETKHEIINFFKQKFRNQIRNKHDGHKKEIDFHVTCAKDISCIKKMFEICRTIIIKKELQIQGFL